MNARPGSLSHCPVSVKSTWRQRLSAVEWRREGETYHRIKHLGRLRFPRLQPQGKLMLEILMVVLRLCTTFTGLYGLWSVIRVQHPPSLWPLHGDLWMLAAILRLFAFQHISLMVSHVLAIWPVQEPSLGNYYSKTAAVNLSFSFRTPSTSWLESGPETNGKENSAWLMGADAYKIRNSTAQRQPWFQTRRVQRSLIFNDMWTHLL